MNHEKIVEKTLKIFSDLTAGIGSVKKLIKLEIIEKLILNHDEKNILFLKTQQNHRNRITYYKLVSQLVFTSKFISKFNFFMDSFAAGFEYLSKQIQMFQMHQITSIEASKILFLNLLSDLQGILSATDNNYYFQFIFSWIFPKYLNFIIKNCSLFYSSVAVISRLFKFLIELTDNTNSRLVNPFIYSSDPLLLFRDISNIITIYGFSFPFSTLPFLSPPHFLIFSTPPPSLPFPLLCNPFILRFPPNIYFSSQLARFLPSFILSYLLYSLSKLSFPPFPCFSFSIQFMSKKGSSLTSIVHFPQSLSLLLAHLTLPSTPFPFLFASSNSLRKIENFGRINSNTDHENEKGKK